MKISLLTVCHSLHSLDPIHQPGRLTADAINYRKPKLISPYQFLLQYSNWQYSQGNNKGLWGSLDNAQQVHYMYKQCIYTYVGHKVLIKSLHCFPRKIGTLQGKLIGTYQHWFLLFMASVVKEIKIHCMCIFSTLIDMTFMCY